jgi:hypothetical protein
MSNHDTDVLARLRAGADRVEERRFDTHAVLARSRRALRRRRARQAIGACTTAAAVTLSLAVAGPVPVPGLGDVTLPGGEQLRELFGLGDPSACEAPEPTVRRTPDPGVPVSMRPRVTYDLTDARPLSTCVDVLIDAVVPSAGRTPETLTVDGGLWAKTPPVGQGGYIISYHPFGTDSGSELTTGDENTLITGLTTEGGRLAWYEFSGESPEELVDSPYTLRTAGTAVGDVRTVAEIPRRDTGWPVMTSERVAWRNGTTVSVAPVDGSAPPRSLAHQATAVGSDNDEIVVASPGQDADGLPTTTFTSYGDDGSVRTLLTAPYPGEEPVSVVDITDDMLVYGPRDDIGDLTIVPRVDGSIAPDVDQIIKVRLSGGGAEELSAAGDAVAWVSGPVAYLLRDTAPNRAGGPDLVRIAQSEARERMMVGLAGDRIAWSVTEGADTVIHVGTLPEAGPHVDTTSPDPAESGTPDGAVPGAPTVTVPENAIFDTYD